MRITSHTKFWGKSVLGMGNCTYKDSEVDSSLKIHVTGTLRIWGEQNTHSKFVIVCIANEEAEA